jgi:hypothetical protein
MFLVVKDSGNVTNSKWGVCSVLEVVAYLGIFIYHGGSYSSVRITNLITVPVIYSFQNITLDKTTVDGNKKGEVLIMQKQDSILYESGDSGCISLETEPDIST